MEVEFSGNSFVHIYNSKNKIMLLTPISYYSISDGLGYFSRNNGDYLTFFTSAEFRSFSVQDKFDYEMPYFNINGDDDYQTNYLLAQVYFDEVNAPYKEIFIMENTTHWLLESKSTLFSEYVHTIAAETLWKSGEVTTDDRA